MNWQEHYRSRTISPDEAAAMVKPGMRVTEFGIARLLGKTIASEPPS